MSILKMFSFRSPDWVFDKLGEENKINPQKSEKTGDTYEAWM